METKDINIILTKSFDELSSNEREKMKDYFVSEEEFIHIKEVFMGVEALKSKPSVPKNETKESLDKLFATSYPKGGTIWYNTVLAALYPSNKSFVRRPLVQIAAVLLLVVLAFPIANKLSNLQPKNQIAQHKMEQNELESNKTETLKTEQFIQPLNEENSVNSKDFDRAIAEETKNVDAVSSEMVADERVEAFLAADIAVAPAAMAATSGYMHPDGIYIEDNESIDYSTGLNEQLDVLDLLTATF